MIGLAEAGGEGLELAKEIYAKALDKKDALCAPYAAVIDIDAGKLPSAGDGAGLVGGAVRRPPCATIRAARRSTRHLRQLIHVGYKIAAQMGDRYLQMLEACEPTIAKNVTENLYERHLKPLFVQG